MKKMKTKKMKIEKIEKLDVLKSVEKKINLNQNVSQTLERNIFLFLTRF